MKALKNSWDSYLNPLYQDPYYKSIIEEMKLRDSLGGVKMITDQISPFIWPTLIFVPFNFEFPWTDKNTF